MARRREWRLMRLTAAISAACALGMVAPRKASAATALFDFSGGISWGSTGDQFNGAPSTADTSLWTFGGGDWHVDGNIGASELTAASRWLTSSTITLDGTPVTVSFLQARKFQAGADGGILESSVNSGAFTQMLGFTTNGYDGVLASGNQNPLEGKAAFWNNASLLASVADLGTQAAGSMLQLRFNAGWDNDNTLASIPVWSIRSVVVTGVQALPAEYWTGEISSTWYGNNWASNQVGDRTAFLPAAGTDIIFSADTVVGGSQNTTLGADFEIHSLTINDPAAVTIGGANTLTISSTERARP